MGASAKEIRSLVALVESASTARVLNLARRDPATRAATAPENTLFRSPVLDRAIVLKHRVRMHERDWFIEPRSVVTKLLIPIDPLDLTIGAHALLVGQTGLDQVLTETLGVDKDPESGDRDRQLLAALNDLPSLDPFLTREHLKRRGFTVADDYFDISTADAARMLDFVRADIVPLITLCFGGGGDSPAADKLAQKILGAELDATMEPLRLTLKMSGPEFVEGIFCWKGFLYYKWLLSDVLRSASEMTRELEGVRMIGKATLEEKTYIVGARERIRSGVKAACRDVRASLLTYDEAFEGLTRRADPTAFRDFLLAAPRMFFDVGEKLGAVQHITSFWRYRFPDPHQGVPAPELFDIFTDFEGSLGAAPSTDQSWAA